MKKFALTLLACLSVSPFAHAALAPLGESLNEYDAIITAIGTNPSFSNVISSTEFIVDIQRITRSTNSLGQVEYEIVTRDPSLATDCGCDEHHHHKHHRHDRNNNSHLYLAVLNVVANPGIGPNIVTVVSITPSICFVDSHHHND